MIRLLSNLFINLHSSRGFVIFSKNSFVHAVFLEMERVGKRARTRGAPRYSAMPSGFRARTGYSTPAALVSARAHFAARRATPVYRTPVLRSCGELKGVDTGVLSAQIGVFLSTTNTNTGVAVINCVAPGSGSFNRVGRKIRMKSLRIRGAVEALCDNNGDPAGTSPRGVVIRMVVVYDKQPSGVVPTYDTIFGHTTQAGTEIGNPLDPLRYDNTGRFRVLRDKVFTINPEYNPLAADAGIVTKRAFDEYIDLKGLETVYSGQSATCTITDISSGALYLWVRKDANTTNTAANFNSDANSRLRYYD